jgi:hypothetical protein
MGLQPNIPQVNFTPEADILNCLTTLGVADIFIYFQVVIYPRVMLSATAF